MGPKDRILYGLYITSGPTPEVASSAAHMYVCSNKLRDAVWVLVFGIDFFKLAPRLGHVWC